MHNVETITASGLLNLLKNAYFGLFIFKMKKRSEATQTLRAGCSKADPQTNTRTDRGDYNTLRSLARSVKILTECRHRFVTY